MLDLSTTEVLVVGMVVQAICSLSIYRFILKPVWSFE